jgi:hypothetical protein
MVGCCFHVYLQPREGLTYGFFGWIESDQATHHQVALNVLSIFTQDSGLLEGDVLQGLTKYIVRLGTR